MKKLLVAVGIVCLIPTMGLTKTITVNEEGVQEAQKIKKGRFFKRALKGVKVTGKTKRLEGKTKVVIPFFRVTFATGGKYINKVGGTITATSKVLSKLNGVEEGSFQTITDNMYANLKAQFVEEGFEILDLSVFEDSKKYNKLQEKNKYPMVKKDKSVYTPEGLAFPKQISTVPFMILPDLDENTLLVKADLVVNFIITNRNEKKFSMNKSKVSVTQGINVLGQLNVLAPKANVMINLQQPVTSDKPFGQVVDETSKADKAGDVAFGVAQWAFGSGLGNRKSTARVEVNSTSDEYIMAAEDALTHVNEIFAQYLKNPDKDKKKKSKKVVESEESENTLIDG